MILANQRKFHTSMHACEADTQEFGNGLKTDGNPIDCLTQRHEEV